MPEHHISWWMNTRKNVFWEDSLDTGAKEIVFADREPALIIQKLGKGSDICFAGSGWHGSVHAAFGRSFRASGEDSVWGTLTSLRMMGEGWSVTKTMKIQNHNHDQRLCYFNFRYFPMISCWVF